MSWPREVTGLPSFIYIYFIFFFSFFSLSFSFSVFFFSVFFFSNFFSSGLLFLWHDKFTRVDPVSKSEREMRMTVSEERKREQKRGGLFRVRKFILVISSDLDVSKGSFGIFLKNSGHLVFSMQFFGLFVQISQKKKVGSYLYEG